jgi:D-alanyl-D-alanine carboxypeptidase (penicillin-binding protein 5/6)
MFGLPAASASPPPSILIEATTGQVLSENLADHPVAEGTFGQLMIVLLSLEQAALGVLPIDVPITVGPTASAHGSTEDSPVVLRRDRTYVLGELIKAILVASSPQAAIAVGEAIAGSAENCVEAMNARAARLSMEDTRFAGPMAGGGGTTTARDLARLAQVLALKPEVLRWASVGDLPFAEANTVLRNRNRLVGVLRGADGLAGSDWHGRYGVMATAVRGNLRLVAVVADAATSEARYEAAAKLLEDGFARYARLDVVRRGEPLNVSIRVSNGVSPYVTPVAADSFTLIHPREGGPSLLFRFQLPTELSAPLAEDQDLGEVVVEAEGRVLGVVRAIAPRSIRASGLLAAAGR